MLPSKFSCGALAVACACLSCATFAQTNVLTYHNDNGRTGANLNETILTPANVNQSTFGKLFTYNLNGCVYAQPLYVSGVNISGQGVHNVIFVATEHNTVYALDADSNTGANSGVLWQANLGSSAPCPAPGFQFNAISPEVGITGTPVIDPVSQTLYVDAFTQSGSSFSHTIHALSITNGAERSFSPVTVSVSIPSSGVGSTNGMLAFLASQELQRSALTLAGGVLYVAYAGFTDTPTTYPFHGWIIGYNASNLQLLSDHVFNSTPNGTVGQYGPIAGSGGIWMGDGGLAVDSNTNLYFSTGDGNFNAFSGGTEYGDSVIKLSTTGGFAVADYFTPYNQAYYRTNDLDVGSGGVMLLPDQPGPVTHLMIAGGKPQYGYLLNRDMMTTDNGHFNSGGSSDHILQSIYLGGGIMTTPAYFRQNIYYVTAGDTIRSYAVANANLTAGTFGTRQYHFPGATLSVSANGANNGIVWAIQYAAPNVLVAYNATNVSTEIYNSAQAGSRDQLANGIKFTVPTVANGKVFVGTTNSVSVFGLLGGALQFNSSNYSTQKNAGAAIITANRTGGSHGAVQVNYATTTGGTAVAGQDYSSTSGTLSWADGDGSAKNFNVTILNNPQPGTNKTVFLTLSNATGGAYLSTPSNAVLTILQDPFSLWKFSHFGANDTNPAIAGDLADPDHDGIPNILEYAFGSDPNTADTNAPLFGSIVINHFQLQFNRNTSATDLTYSAQASPALNSTWSNLMSYLAGSSAWTTNTPGSTVSESGPSGSPPDQHVHVTITDPVNTTSPAATNRFFQLKVQH
jgi:hypothetical protein